VNIVTADSVISPLKQDGELADTGKGSEWDVVPVVFTEPYLKTNLLLKKLIILDAHVNPCVFKKFNDNANPHS